MPSAGKQKYYAVRNGRQGPAIYFTWEQAKANVTRFPGAAHKSFTDIGAAREWLGVIPIPQQTPAPVDQTQPRTYAAAGPSKLQQQAEPADSRNVSTSGAASARQEPPSIVLSPEQKAVLEMVKAGKSVFFTGSAGTGKSVLLREIINACGGPRTKALGVTAATGIASVNIGGSTLHSWAGIGLGKETAEKLAGKLLGQDKYQRMKEMQKNKEQGGDSDYGWESDSPKNTPVVDRWRKVRTLIIDEISMIDGGLFDKLEYIATVLRRDSRPFGGIQLVLSGDFCQLPPVPDRVNGVQGPVTFAFDARSWNRCVGPPVVLRRVFRQKDQAFVDMLNEMRLGHMNPATIKAFQSLSRQVTYTDGIEPTQLFPLRNEVEAANSSRLNKIPKPVHQYTATDSPGYDENNVPISSERMKKALKLLVAPETIALKEGAQVMLIKNLIQGELVNGSVGRVTGFRTARDAFKLGASVEVQGKLVQAGDNDKEKAPVPEQLLRNDDVWPVVRFQNGREVLCVPATWEVNNADGRLEAQRQQVPLILAWALSIHKSQGQTLERVSVDLGRIFEKGQAYVALSRATSMDTLQVLRFDAGRVMAHPRVLKWNSEITGQTDDEPQDELDVDEELEYWNDLL